MSPGAARRTIVLDRDGTMIVDYGYLDDPERIALLPGALAGLKAWMARGNRLIIVSNQSGIGRGRLTVELVDQINGRLLEMLAREGVRIDAVYYCRHAPEDGCDCRKPRPGLVHQAAAELGVRPQDCVVVGDIGGDVAAARAAGSRSVLIPTPRTRIEELAGARIATDLLAAARWIIGQGDPRPAAGSANGDRR